MKPDISEAPKWANWLAQNYSGQWIWFEKEPHARRVSWGSLEISSRSKIDHKINDNWKDTLESTKIGTYDDVMEAIKNET